MEYEVAKLEGALLDAAVAMALGYKSAAQVPEDLCGMWYVGESDGGIKNWTPSTDWAQGGPIIERESIAVFRQEWSDGSLRDWMAGSSHDLDEGPKMAGPTPLIAAMRAYVASKFGETVELP